MTEIDRTICKYMKRAKLGLMPEYLKNKSVAIVSRYRPGSRLDNIYSVIAHNIIGMFRFCGSDVDTYYCPSRNNLRKQYNIGIVCYYDTFGLSSHSPIPSVPSRCKYSVFYSNLVPRCRGFDKYCVSRKDYLDNKHCLYGMSDYRKCFPNIKKSVFAGRGVDPFLFTPEQESFEVVVDASRNPYRQSVAKSSVELVKYLSTRGVKVRLLGFKLNGSKKSSIHHRSVASMFSKTSVYISSIKGLYELPVIESQCAGNYVISYKSKLHNDLLCPESSYSCNTPDLVYETIQKIRKSYDSSIPRQHMIKYFSWPKVLNRILKGEY